MAAGTTYSNLLPGVPLTFGDGWRCELCGKIKFCFVLRGSAGESGVTTCRRCLAIVVNLMRGLEEEA